MLSEDPDRVAKIAELRTLQAAGTAPRVAELVLVQWPDPDGAIYYATRTAADLLESDIVLDQLDGPIELRLGSGVFLEAPHDAGIADDQIELDWWDQDGELTRLILTHGAGVRVEVFYYFPDVDLFLSEWWGHLQPPTAIALERLQARAEVGFRSSNLPLPARAFFTGCQAVFGGLLETQAEIDEGDCPYNAHLAGTGGEALIEADWTNEANGTAGTAGAFLKTAGGLAWNCGAAHNEPLLEGEAAIHFTIAGGYATVGFFSTDTPRSGNENTWACLQFNPDHTVTIKHSNDNTLERGNATSWAAAGGFSIQLRAGAFHFYAGTTEILLPDFVAPPPVYPLYLGIAVMSVGAGVSTCYVAVGEAGPAPSFGLIDPATGVAFTSCPRNKPAECIARLGDSKSYLAFDTVAESHVVHETKGPNLTVTSRGNENNLKRPLRVIAGARHVSDLDLLAFVVEPNTNHPDEGSVKCLFAVCEGKIKSLNNGKINANTIAPMHRNYALGEKRQSQTSFSPNILNYSGTALFLGVAQGDFTAAGAEDLRGEIDVEGLANVRRYWDQENYAEEYSTERGWWLLHVLRNKRWGYGLDAARVFMQDWIDLGVWCKQIVAQKDKDGNDTTGPRTQFSAELIDRTAQQQIADICLAGRFSLPFPHRGQLRVVPLQRATELFSAVVFTDQAHFGALERAPTAGELEAWFEALAAARVLGNDELLAECTARLEALFVSAEYTARARTDEQFVNDCYRAYLRRDGEAAGIAAWLTVLPTVGRAGVRAGFAGADEFIIACTDQDVPTFTDRGEERNVCFAGNKSTLAFSLQSDAELCNRIVLTFDDGAQQNAQVPLTFEDVEQQLRAGRSFGDTSRRVVEKQYNAFGVTSIGEAGRLGNLLLDLGEFDEGGLANNLRVAFTTWYLEAVEISKYQIIRIACAKLDQVNAPRLEQGLEPFQYFRVRSLTRQADLTVEINAQAYPVVYYDRLELLTRGPDLPPIVPGEGGFDPEDPTGPPRERLPYEVTLHDLGYTSGHISMTIGKDAL